MRLLVKNMVCPRCISAVKSILTSEGLMVKSVSLGDVEIEESLSDEERQSLAGKLRGIGFELLDDPRSQLVEQIRLTVLDWVRSEEERPRLSDYLSRQLSKDYSSLSKLFSEVKGITIERFAIHPSHRVREGIALLQPAFHKRDSLQAWIQFAGISLLTVQTSDRNDTKGISRTRTSRKNLP